MTLKRPSRKTQSGRKLKEAIEPVQLTIETKVPSKWLFVDTETGDVWMTTGDKHWYRPSLDELTELLFVSVAALAQATRKD